MKMVKQLLHINTISLHTPERMTVNHDVTGSSPVGGAKGGS